MFYPTRYYTRAVIVARMCCQKREGHDKSGEIKDYEIVGSYFRQNVYTHLTMLIPTYDKLYYSIYYIVYIMDRLYKQPNISPYVL